MLYAAQDTTAKSAAQALKYRVGQLLIAVLIF